MKKDVRQDVLCLDCKTIIPEERVEILLGQKWPMRCVKCSKVEAPAVFMDFGHKTGGEIVVVPNNPDGTRDPEKVRLAVRCFRRSR